MVLQDSLKKDYNISWYEHWYYDHDTGLFTLSTGDSELNFRFFTVGTFSNNTKTWKWSWDNEDTLDNAKEPTLAVKEYGEGHGYDRLTTGYFPTDEIEAWALTAIAARLNKGIGAYRAVDEHLLIFMVLTELVDNERAQEIKNKIIECDVHGTGRIGYVCKHLLSRSRVGFEEAFETFPGMELGEDDDLQAWCAECENVRSAEGEWNDQSMEFADIRVVCEHCYFEIKELNLGHK